MTSGTLLTEFLETPCLFSGSGGGGGGGSFASCPPAFRVKWKAVGVGGGFGTLGVRSLVVASETENSCLPPLVA